MEKPIILIVDDEPVNLAVLAELLRPEYRVRATTSGADALVVAALSPRPDLILLDVMMPRMDGYEVLRRLQAAAETRDVPVIFLTALAAPSDEEQGLAAGAVDYITKPIKPVVLHARVKTQLEAARARMFLRDQNAFLEAEVQRRMMDHELAQQVGIRALAQLAETRDAETGGHIRRTQAYVELLAGALRDHPRFSGFLTPENISLLVKSAPLHDIGKVGIPDSILLKQGPLTPDEMEVMQRHPRLGFEAIERAEADVERTVPFLVLAKEIACWHHEHWDGSGYPDGLAGDAIPVSARIMAVADVFDAMTTPRVYKPALSLEAARDYIAGNRGTHFDPDVVDAFVAVQEQFFAVARQYVEPSGH